MTVQLADRIRAEIGDNPNCGEIRMFGGICFTLNGNMLLGIMKDGNLLARVGKDQERQGLTMAGASKMNFTGREMKGFIVVSSDALDAAALKHWIAMATLKPGGSCAIAVFIRRWKETWMLGRSTSRRGWTSYTA